MRCPVVVVSSQRRYWRVGDGAAQCLRRTVRAALSPLFPLSNLERGEQLPIGEACGPPAFQLSNQRAGRAMTCLACLGCPNPTPGVTVPQVTLDSRPWARPCPASTWRTNPSSSPNFAVCCSLSLFYFNFYFILGFQSVAVLCPAAFQHHDGVVDSSSFRGGLSLSSASGRGGLRFGVLTLEGVPGVVGISSKQPEHSFHV